MAGRSAPEVLACFRELIAGAPDELTMLAVMRLAPPAPWIPAEHHGKPVVMLVSFYSGDPEDAPALLAPLDALGTPVAEAEGPKPYVALQKLFDAGQVDGFQNYWKAEYLSALPDEAIAAMSEHGSRISSPLSDTKILQTGGAAARMRDDSAIGHRGAPMVFNINSRWQDAGEAERHMRWTNGFHEAMKPFSFGGSYVNFLGEEGDERVRSAYGDKYERLQSVKRRLDPGNVFRMNQNIRP